ncbi:insulin-like peptide INSL5 [Ambystoma mexicanum]|uniref:insulin-like peptide INSL5 n=1 Tax=Ambystoma mexicanum TaxID=8296 RepID=UPI0037E95F45
MRASLLCFFLLSLLAAHSVVKADGPSVKLCGREFIRAVIYTCGGSRWRRNVPGPSQDLPERRSSFYFSAGNLDLGDSEENALQKFGFEKEARRDTEPQQPQPAGQPWQGQENSVQGRRDLNQLLTTACCKSGCSKKDLSSLC